MIVTKTLFILNIYFNNFNVKLRLKSQMDINIYKIFIEWQLVKIFYEKE